jgi:hypothetical protein
MVRNREARKERTMEDQRAASGGKRWMRLLLAAVAAALVALPLPTGAFAGAGPPPGHGHIWGYEAGFSSRILEYNIDPTTGLVTFSGFQCVPLPHADRNGRGVAHDPAAPGVGTFPGGELLWYTNLIGFQGDGFIHRTTLPSTIPPCQFRGSIPFGEGPGPPNQDGIGALDLDPDDSNILWAAGYLATPPTGFPDTGGGFQLLYKVRKTDGAILGRCKSPQRTPGLGGNDTITVATLPGIGKVLLTDFGEFSPIVTPPSLAAVDVNSVTGPPAPAVAPDCRIVREFPFPQQPTGIDYEPVPPTGNESLVAANVSTSTQGPTFLNRNGPPFAAATLMGPTAPSVTIEDISLVSEEACPPEDDDDNGDGRRDDDDDDDDDGLTDRNESLFLTLLGNRDSDLDGIVDGNDDANGNGEDDEDEDDDECPDDDDDDGDGIDNEDEDDDEDDD